MVLKVNLTRKLRALIKAGQFLERYFIESWLVWSVSSFQAALCHSIVCFRPDFATVCRLLATKTRSHERCKKSFNKVLIKSYSISCSTLPWYPQIHIAPCSKYRAHYVIMFCFFWISSNLIESMSEIALTKSIGRWWKRNRTDISGTKTRGLQLQTL